MQRIDGAGCSYDTCPAVWDDGETVVFRGDMVDQATVVRTDDEAVVRLPREMVVEAAKRLTSG